MNIPTAGASGTAYPDDLMVTVFALAAALLYGSADFLGGAATRRAHVLSVLTVSATAGVAVTGAAALLAGGPPRGAGIGWGIGAGAAGGGGVLVFFARVPGRAERRPPPPSPPR